MCDDQMNDEISAKELSFEPIRLMEIELESEKRQWLAKQGWTHTSSFIDSHWRWCKEIKGTMMMCSLDEALNIELKHLID